MAAVARTDIKINKWSSTQRPHRRNVCLRRYMLIGLGVTLTWKWPLTLKTFSAMPTHMMNICVKFHWNPSTKYRDIAPRETGVNGRTDGQPDEPPENTMPSPRIVGESIMKRTL